MKETIDSMGPDFLRLSMKGSEDRIEQVFCLIFKCNILLKISKTIPFNEIDAGLYGLKDRMGQTYLPLALEDG